MDEKLRELQLTELELFKKFANICKENNITYYALGGTLLGAIRHRGFIPWDDDMDIGVPRPDYDRLERILALYQDESFSYHTFHNDEQYVRYFGHIEDQRIKIIRKDKIVEEHSCAWIDIFPLDAMPSNIVLRKIWILYVLVLRAFYRFSCFDTLVDVNKKNRPLHEKILIFIGLHTPIRKCFDTRKCLLRLEKVLTKFDYETSDYLVNAMGAYKFKEMFHKKYYGKGKDYSFEDTVIHGPDDYDFVCRQLYGDYMTPPKENDRNHHKSAVVDKI